MLRELAVQNLATIEDIRVELESGFCVWTGETGAGKTLLLTAIGLVLGERASAEMVRSGKPEARAAAVFNITDPRLKSEIEAVLGIALEDNDLILTRRITPNGRSIASANGLPVTIGALQKLGDLLVDTHGQNEGRALLHPDRQRALLDAYGNHQELVQRYQSARMTHADLLRKRALLIDSSQTRARERALLEFERDELGAANPKVGEYEELLRESHLLANLEALRSTAGEAYRWLYEDDQSALTLLKRTARSLRPLSGQVAEFHEAASTLERLAAETSEVAQALRGLVERCDDDPAARLEEVEARLALYRRLATRFHCGPDELAARRSETEARLELLDQQESDLKHLDGPITQAFDALQAAAAALSAARRNAARELGQQIQSRLKTLGLSQARLAVEVETSNPGNDPYAPSPEYGWDRIEILFAANPGEPPRPLRKTASGGELSRVTLAAKAVLAEADRVPTLLFDEVETGVGGRLGHALGKTLAELARHRQVICITHLPQLASFADRHWVIRKGDEQGRTRTTITPVSEDERVDELATMLRGESAAEGTRREARAMLTEARAFTLAASSGRVETP